MRIKNLTFGYSPDRILIDNLSIDIGKNDRICVIGKNGKGKSTLLRLLAKELEPVSGEINPHPNCMIGYFGQTNIERLNPKLTIEEEFSRLRPDMNYTDIRRTCGAMMFTGDLALKRISVLSGGEKSRVSLGKILLSPTNLLLLDEPTNHLDIESCDSMIEAIDEFSGAVVIVTHSEMFLHHLANRLIVFNEDRAFLFEGTYQDFLDRIGWEEDSSKPKKSKKSEGDKKSSGKIQKKIDTPEEEYNKKHKSLHEKIAKIEKEIDDEEAKLEDVNTKLTEAIVESRTEEIKLFQIEAHKRQQALDLGYKELENLIAELDLLDKTRP